MCPGRRASEAGFRSSIGGSRRKRLKPPPLSGLLRCVMSPQPRQRLHRRVWDISNLHTPETFQNGCNNNFDALSTCCVSALANLAPDKHQLFELTVTSVIGAPRGKQRASRRKIKGSVRAHARTPSEPTRAVHSGSKQHGSENCLLGDDSRSRWNNEVGHWLASYPQDYHHAQPRRLQPPSRSCPRYPTNPAARLSRRPAKSKFRATAASSPFRDARRGCGYNARARSSEGPRDTDWPTQYTSMRSSWTTQFGQGPHLSTRRIAHPVIVTEQHADPVELLYLAFCRLDAEQRRRLLTRIGRP